MLYVHRECFTAQCFQWKIHQAPILVAPLSFFRFADAFTRPPMIPSCSFLWPCHGRTCFQQITSTEFALPKNPFVFFVYPWLPPYVYTAGIVSKPPIRYIYYKTLTNFGHLRFIIRSSRISFISTVSCGS